MKSLVRFRSRASALPWLVAATTLLMLLASAAVLALDAAADRLRDATERRLIVQVVDADVAERGRIVATALERLRLTPGARAQLVERGEVARLIEPYIGDMEPADPTLPAMVDVTLGGGVDQARLVRRLRGIDHVEVHVAARAGSPFLRLVTALRGTAVIVGMLTVAATGLIAGLAARAAFASEQETLRVLHQLGATDRQITRLVVGRIGREAAIGAGAGLLLTLPLVGLLARRLTPLGLQGFGWTGWLALALLAGGLCLLVVLVAQATLMVQLRRTP